MGSTAGRRRRCARTSCSGGDANNRLLFASRRADTDECIRHPLPCGKAGLPTLRDIALTKRPMIPDSLAHPESPSRFPNQSAEVAQAYRASTTMIGRTGFGPHHASDRTISRPCPAEIANERRSDLFGNNQQHPKPDISKNSSVRPWRAVPTIFIND
jgi:hypothetical protein